MQHRIRSGSVSYYIGVSAIQLGTLLFILTISGMYQPFFQPPPVRAVSVAPPPPPELVIQSGRPIRLHIPSLGIDRDLLDGTYNTADNSWSLSPRGVHYALGSAPANDYAGSTFIYGHNNTHVFGPLIKLSEGAVAEITTDNNLRFSYTFTQRDTLQPDDTSPLTYQDSPRLTLQTCSGNWHQLRELFYFELTDVTEV